MVCSEAQLRSNRENALRSTGPRTPEGKARSRANGLKHGLTGDGIVVPIEDAAEVDQRFETLEAEMQPNNAMARQLVLRVALLTVRLDRSAEHEAKAISFKMRKATAAFDDARLAEVENYYSWLAAEPLTNARRLRGSPEGIDLLLDAFEGLRFDLTHPEGMRWDWAHCERLHHLMGRRMMDLPVSRAKAFSDAMNGDFKHLYPSDGEGLDPIARKKWAFEALVSLIDEQIAKLNKLREGMDFEGLALDRLEAPSRVLFDPSPDAILARKYEAANERSLYRALREFREVQKEFAQVEASPAVASEPPDELGSCFLDPAEDEAKASYLDATDPKVSNQVVNLAIENAGSAIGASRERKQAASRRARK